LPVLPNFRLPACHLLSDRVKVLLEDPWLVWVRAQLVVGRTLRLLSFADTMDMSLYWLWRLYANRKT
jgi:hypothetical protein